MFHFSLLVVSSSRPTEEELAAQLQPFHEFECTGIDDQYVQDVDKTAEALEAFAKATEVRLRGPDGVLHDRFDEAGNWKPEFSKPGKHSHSQREEFVPPGFERIELPASEVEVAAEWISDYFGWGIAGKDSAEDLKAGYIELDADGNVAKCVDRTNPNKQWDWWVMGGRWSGLLRVKPGVEPVKGRKGLMGSCRNDGPQFADQATLAEIDIDGMREADRKAFGDLWDKTAAAAGHLPRPEAWATVRDRHKDTGLEGARTEYWGQPALEALKVAFPQDWGLDRPLLALSMTRDDYCELGARGALSTFALLKDGQWIERGQMLMFGTAANEKPKVDWVEEFNAAIDGMPPETCLTVIDCHI